MQSAPNKVRSFFFKKNLQLRNVSLLKILLREFSGFHLGAKLHDMALLFAEARSTKGCP